MNVNRNITYTASEFRMEDLRQIVTDNPDVPPGALVRIRVTGGDRPYESTTYKIEICR